MKAKVCTCAHTSVVWFVCVGVHPVRLSSTKLGACALSAFVKYTASFLLRQRHPAEWHGTQALLSAVNFRSGISCTSMRPGTVPNRCKILFTHLRPCQQDDICRQTVRTQHLFRVLPPAPCAATPLARAAQQQSCLGLGFGLSLFNQPLSLNCLQACGVCWMASCRMRRAPSSRSA